MAEAVAEVVAEAPHGTVQSPPVADRPVQEAEDPRAALHAMARELVRTRNRRLLVEYLRLRRRFR